MAAQIIIIVLLIFSLGPIIKDFLYSDYNKYSELIYDLKERSNFFIQKKILYLQIREYIK